MQISRSSSSNSPALRFGRTSSPLFLNSQEDIPVSPKHAVTKISETGVVCNAIARLYQTRKHSDVIFVIGNEKMTFRAHQLILAAHSSVFETLFFGDDFGSPGPPITRIQPSTRMNSRQSASPSSSPPPSEKLLSPDLIPSFFQVCESLGVPHKFQEKNDREHKGRSFSPMSPQNSKTKTFRFPETESDVFAALLQFLYSGEVYIDDVLAMPLLGLASTFQITPLKVKCAEYISRRISSSTVVRFLEDAVAYDCPLLYEKCFLFILDNFSEVALTKEFREDFSEAQLKKILQSDEVNASEICIFISLVRWGVLQVQTRPAEFEQVGLQQVLSNLMKLVRWSLMTPEEIVDIVRPLGVASVEDLFEALAMRHSNHQGGNQGLLSRRGSNAKFPCEEANEQLHLELQQLRVSKPILPGSPGSSGECSPIQSSILYSPPPTATLNVEKRVISKPKEDGVDSPINQDRTPLTPDSSYSSKKEKKKHEKKIQLKPNSPRTSSKTGPMVYHKSSSWASGRKRSDSAEEQTIITSGRWDQENDKNCFQTGTLSFSSSNDPLSLATGQGEPSDELLSDYMAPKTYHSPVAFTSSTPRKEKKKKCDSQANSKRPPERREKTSSSDSPHGISPPPPKQKMPTTPKVTGKKKRRGSNQNLDKKAFNLKLKERDLQLDPPIP